MSDLLGEYRQIWLALHIISFISWMAGMLYLPRLFVYHTTVETGSETSGIFKIMERRLLKAIINPAMIATWIFGLLLLASQDFVQLTQWWMVAKLACVLALSGIHGVFVSSVRKFANDENTRTQRYYRFINEGPTVLMILIVFLVIVAGR